jgi:hypothetical protein
VRGRSVGPGGGNSRWGDHHAHSALDKSLSVDDWDVDMAYVFCDSNIEVRDKITYLPWYMIMYLKPGMLPEHLLVDLDLSGLDAQSD